MKELILIVLYVVQLIVFYALNHFWIHQLEFAKFQKMQMKIVCFTKITQINVQDAYQITGQKIINAKKFLNQLKDVLYTKTKQLVIFVMKTSLMIKVTVMEIHAHNLMLIVESVMKRIQRKCVIHVQMGTLLVKMEKVVLTLEMLIFY